MMTKQTSNLWIDGRPSVPQAFRQSRAVENDRLVPTATRLDASREFRTSPIDLGLLEVQLPRLITSSPSHFPIVATTARVEQPKPASSAHRVEPPLNTLLNPTLM